MCCLWILISFLEAQKDIAIRICYIINTNKNTLVYIGFQAHFLMGLKRTLLFSNKSQMFKQPFRDTLFFAELLWSIYKVALIIRKKYLEWYIKCQAEIGLSFDF